MELKDFIKQVLADVTNAVSESQQELKNGCVICPSNIAVDGVGEHVKAKGGETLKVSSVDFDVAVTVEKTDGINAKFGVVAAVINGGASGSSSDKSQELSRIKFAVPLIYPRVFVDKAPSTTYNYGTVPYSR